MLASEKRKPEDIGYTVSQSIKAFTNPKYSEVYRTLLDLGNFNKTLYELSTIDKQIKWINDISRNPQSLIGDIPSLLKQLKKIEIDFHQRKPIDPKNILIKHSLGIEIPKFLDLDYINKIQNIISTIQEAQNVKVNLASQELQEVEADLKKGKTPNYKKIILLIGILFTVLSWLIANYPNLKEIYKDFTYDPITTICGVLSDLEKEAVKFVEVHHRGGIPLYVYPTGKKSDHYLIDGIQICMITKPKGNEKRVKVVYQLENHTQITGYVERNKIKQLYKID